MSRDEEYLYNSRFVVLQSISRSWMDKLDEVADSWEGLFESQRLSKIIASASAFSLLSSWSTEIEQRLSSAVAQYFIDVLIYTIESTELAVIDDISKSPQYARTIDIFCDSFFSHLRKLVKMEAIYIDKYVVGHNDMIDLYELNSDLTKTISKFMDYIDSIIKSETSKLIIAGKILAWSRDRDNTYYNYWWDTLKDDKTKDISLLFESGNPYSLINLNQVFVGDHSKPHRIVNRKTKKLEWQVSSYNCRCSVRRTPKSKEQMVNEGLLSYLNR